MGSGFSKMRKQQKKLEEHMKQMQEEMQKKEVTGKSPGDLVQIVINGEKNVKSVKINPECVDPNDVEGLQDLIIAAFADASKKLSQQEGPKLDSLPHFF